MGKLLYFKELQGIYEVPEVARLLSATLKQDIPSMPSMQDINSSNLIRWIRAGLSDPEITRVHGRELLISFEDLISLRVIAIMRAIGISWAKIRVAEQWLRNHTGHQRPFALQQLWTETIDIFAEFQEHLIAASRHGQLAFSELLKGILEPVVGDMKFGERHIATTWRPHPDVLMDPTVQFGEPCIEGTRIVTRSCWEMFRGGDSVSYLARSFHLADEQIEHALEWEDRLAAA